MSRKIKCTNCLEIKENKYDCYECYNCNISGCSKCINIVCSDCSERMCTSCSGNGDNRCACYGNCSYCSKNVDRGNDGWPCYECRKWLCSDCKYKSKCNECREN